KRFAVLLGRLNGPAVLTIRQNLAQNLHRPITRLDGSGFIYHPAPLDMIIAGRATLVTAKIKALALLIFKINDDIRRPPQAVQNIGHILVAIGVRRDVIRGYFYVVEQRAGGEIKLAATTQHKDERHQRAPAAYFYRERVSIHGERV